MTATVHRWMGCLALLIVALAGCRSTQTPPTAVPTALPPTWTPAPTLAPTAVVARTDLVLCSTEPTAASPFYSFQAGADLLALFYEEPVERVGYRWEARLVERVPELGTGDAVTRTAKVSQGTRYADALGVVSLHEDPEPNDLPQLVVTFTLKSDLAWSDGEPITARDAVLGYHLAQSPEATGRWSELAERTARFVAVDDQTLRWEGIPGYLSSDYAGFLFPLQPAHRWQGHALAELLEDRTPPATGPFEITAWETGREVRLAPNPHYAGEAPQLERVIVRFPQLPPEQWSGLLANGTCDVVLPDPILLTSWEPWEQLGQAGEAVVWADVAPNVLRLDVNLAGEASSEAAQTAIQDVAIRKALSACINRELLTEALPGEAVATADGFIPLNHPAHAGTTQPGYDPGRAERLLEGAGWRDEDDDGTREAHDIDGLSDEEPLTLTLHFASEYFIVAAHVASDLEACGIDIGLEPTDVRQLYTPGDASPLFSHQYDLALIGWQAVLPRVCGAWFSDRVPALENDQRGENFSGFTSEAYDTACARALAAVDLDEQAEALQAAQTLLNAELASIFIAWRPFWFAARPDIAGLKPDASAFGTIWNIEEIAIATPTPEG